MQILITGIAGFLGSQIADYLSQQGHHVVGTVSCASRTKDSPYETHVFDLHDQIDIALLQGVDAVIHCAHFFGKEHNESVNIQGSESLMSGVERVGIKRLIYFSSYTARDNAQSEYGRVKYAIEKQALSRGWSVLKPGLVVGNGGLFYRTVDLLKRAWVFPLVDGGRAIVPVLAMKDLATTVNALLNTPKPGKAFLLFNNERVTMVELYKKIRKKFKSKAVFISIPYSLAYLAFFALQYVPIKLPVNLENLKGYKSNRALTVESDLAQFVASPDSLASMIQTLR